MEAPELLTKDSVEDVREEIVQLEASLKTRVEGLLKEVHTLQSKKRILLSDIQALDRLPDRKPRRSVSLCHRLIRSGSSSFLGKSPMLSLRGLETSSSDEDIQ